MSEPLPLFVAKRRETWARLESLLARLPKRNLSLSELEELDQLYRRSAADLARAQAAYPGTEAHRFLNGLCAAAYAAIYQAPRGRWDQVLAFYRIGFPRQVRANANYVWLSLGLLVLGLLIGGTVTWLEPYGAEALVPETVRQAVKAHEMWTDGMLSVAPPGYYASSIATNNLTVTVSAFSGGLLLGVGTLMVMLYNGLLVGAVVVHCIRGGMGFAAFSFMGAHGPVELTTIVLSGAAGLMVGHALLDPGELPRKDRLQQRGVEAVQLVLGSAPFLAAIGWVEGFVSPGNLFSGAAKIALGLMLGAAFWIYLARAGRAPTPTEASRSARRAAR